MFAMLPTAFSYGRMAAQYPVAGSVYTYVARGLHPQLGFLAGWAASLDYLLIPIVNVIYCAVTMHRVVPAVPYVLWAVFFASLSTSLNLRGVRAGVRANQVLLVVMATVLVAVTVLAVRYIVLAQGLSGLFSVIPFYEPNAFDIRTIATATSFAALTYIGFDAVTTRAEEVDNPRRNVARATVSVCLITGLGSIAIVYLAQLVWPRYEDFQNFDTAFLDVAQRVGGAWLFGFMVIALIIGSFGSAFTGQAGAARLMFGMGRSGVLPFRLFSHLNSRTLQPNYNLWIVGLLALVGAMMLSFERAGELLNFGAFLAFMGVNLAALRTPIVELRRGGAIHALGLVLPTIGFVSCLGIWLNLPAPAWHAGFAWMTVGLIYQFIRTRGFRTPIEINVERSARVAELTPSLGSSPLK
jgi:putrescine importer